VSQKKSWVVMVGEYTQLAFVLPVATFVGYVIGYLLDRAFGTHFFYLVFLLIGIAAGFLQIIRKVTKDSENSD
jgi:F0F1-type ATP synthase assembly protein I